METTEIEEVEIEITDEQLDFLTRELGLTFEDLENLDDDGWEKVYNDCADIEIKESMDHPDEETERCRIASEIVDLLSM
jgi:hypothetical protein